MIIDLLIFSIAFSFAFIIKSILKQYIWVIPTSMIAGFLAFMGSSEVLGVYSFSSNSSFYIDIFLSFIFAGFPLSLKRLNTDFITKVKTLWQYSALQYLSQWGGSLLIVIILIRKVFPFVSDQFGIMLPTGFAGGHGSAAVVGDLLQKQGFEEALGLAMTFATIGAMTSLIGGTLWIFWGKSRGYIKNFSFAQQDYKRDHSLDIKTFIVLIAIVFISYFLRPVLMSVLNFEVPIFVITVIVSVICRLLRSKTIYDSSTLEKVTNTSTDLLVCIGIASIKLLVIAKYSYPILIMSGFGIVLCLIYFIKFGLKVFDEDSFLKALFTWGWSTGGLVFGLALVKMVNKQDNMKIVEQFAFTYLMLAPIEITLLLAMPYLVTQGYGLFISILLILLSLVLIKLLAKKSDKVLK